MNAPPTPGHPGSTTQANPCKPEAVPADPAGGPLKEDGVTNPRDGRGPLRNTDDQSAGLPLRTDDKG